LAAFAPQTRITASVACSISFTLPAAPSVTGLVQRDSASVLSCCGFDLGTIFAGLSLQLASHLVRIDHIDHVKYRED
jgi:hypothetical protein